MFTVAPDPMPVTVFVVAPVAKEYFVPLDLIATPVIAPPETEVTCTDAPLPAPETMFSKSPTEYPVPPPPADTFWTPVLRLEYEKVSAPIAVILIVAPVPPPPDVLRGEFSIA
jgi:hypothetical protein